MKVGLSLAIACSVAALPLRSAWACASCTAGDPALLGSGVEQPFEGRLRLSLTTREWSDATGSGDYLLPLLIYPIAIACVIGVLRKNRGLRLG